MKTVKNESAKTSKIPKPFIAPGSTIKPTAEEIYNRKVKIKRAEEIGASITRVTDEEEVENPYRVKALLYINKGEKVPEELKIKIKEFDKIHANRTKPANTQK